MADRWMDERDRERRDRDWRRSEDQGRGERERRYTGGEERSWGASAEDERRGGYGARRSGSDRDRVFGERETGMGYGGEDYGAGDYERERRDDWGGDDRGSRAGVGAAYGAYGGGEGYGRTGGGRTSAYRGEGERYGGGRYGGEWRSGGWQDRDYGGVSPAMEHDEYEAERRAERYEREHGYEDRYGQPRMGGGYEGQVRDGGRYYGDSGREPIYREEWSQGRRDYGPAPRGYDAGRPYAGRYDRDWEERRARSYSTGGVVSGGTGGYDYERGYGDGGRERYPESRYGSAYEGRDRDWRREEDRGQRFERGGREAGDFFRRAGERVASWFGGGGERRREDDRDRGFQGMGPKGYQRPDERINEEAHERLTDDAWLDASNVSVSVSGGEVTLSGTVESREAKHRAERIVEDVSGVRHVQNNLRVEPGNPLTSAPSRGYGDSVIQAQMRQAETRANSPGTTDGGSTVSGSSSGSSGSTSTDTGKSR